jgi:hypothetical protein
MLCIRIWLEFRLILFPSSGSKSKPNNHPAGRALKMEEAHSSETGEFLWDYEASGPRG